MSSQSDQDTPPPSSFQSTYESTEENTEESPSQVSHLGHDSDNDVKSPSQDNHSPRSVPAHRNGAPDNNQSLSYEVHPLPMMTMQATCLAPGLGDLIMSNPIRLDRHLCAGPIVKGDPRQQPFALPSNKISCDINSIMPLLDPAKASYKEYGAMRYIIDRNPGHKGGNNTLKELYVGFLGNKLRSETGPQDPTLHEQISLFAAGMGHTSPFGEREDIKEDIDSMAPASSPSSRTWDFGSPPRSGSKRHAYAEGDSHLMSVAKVASKPNDSPASSPTFDVKLPAGITKSKAAPEGPIQFEKGHESMDASQKAGDQVVPSTSNLACINTTAEAPPNPSSNKADATSCSSIMMTPESSVISEPLTKPAKKSKSKEEKKEKKKRRKGKKIQRGPKGGKKGKKLAPEQNDQQRLDSVPEQEPSVIMGQIEENTVTGACETEAHDNTESMPSLDTADENFGQATAEDDVGNIEDDIQAKPPSPSVKIGHEELGEQTEEKPKEMTSEPREKHENDSEDILLDVEAQEEEEEEDEICRHTLIRELVRRESLYGDFKGPHYHLRQEDRRNLPPMDVSVLQSENEHILEVRQRKRNEATRRYSQPRWMFSKDARAWEDFEIPPMLITPPEREKPTPTSYEPAQY